MRSLWPREPKIKAFRDTSRIISGHRYYLRNVALTKAEANRKASEFRAKGHLVRIISRSKNEKDVWVHFR